MKRMLFIIFICIINPNFCHNLYTVNRVWLVMSLSENNFKSIGYSCPAVVGLQTHQTTDIVIYLQA
jgi:hypothetical protein